MSIGMLTGCGEKNEEKMIECHSSKKEETYETTSNYKIYAVDNIVKKIEAIETVTTSDEALLTTFEKKLNETYEQQNKLYGGYTFHIDKTKTDLKSNVTIDYDKVDMKKLATDNEAIKKLVNQKNQLTIKSAIEIYENRGATCEK